MKKTQTPQSITLVDDFLSTMKRQRFNPKTIANRRESLKRFRDFLTEKTITRFQDVTVSLLQQYRHSLAKNKLSANTIELHLRAVRRFFDHLEAQSLLFENPTRKIILHQKSNTSVYTLTPDECQRLFKPSLIATNMGRRDHLIIRMLYECTLRTEELLNLTIFDIDQDQKTLRVIGKNRRQRLLPLSDSLLTCLRNYTEHIRHPMIKNITSGTAALWIDRFGRALSLGALQQLLRAYGIKAQISCRLSSPLLRRSGICNHLHKGVDPVTFAAALGYPDVHTLARYLKTTAPQLKKHQQRNQKNKHHHSS